MIKPISDSVFDPHSRYSFVVAVAKRAREIASQAEQQGDILIEKPVDLAIEDYIENKFEIVDEIGAFKPGEATSSGSN